MFDVFVGIDWSGSKSPKRSFSIAYSSCRQDSDKPPLYEHSKLSRTDVFIKLCDLIESDNRALVGIDCNFGYNHAVGKKQFGVDVNAFKFWRFLDELNVSNENFFAGNYWQHSKYKGYFWTEGSQPEWYHLDKLRRTTEIKAIAQGAGVPETPFKLIGAKQVGKGGLAGMRMAYSLKTEFQDKVAIWPFDQDKCKMAKLVITEIYPRLFIRHANFGNRKIRDIRSLNQILNHFGSKSFSNQKHELNDHLTDAIISSAALRWFNQYEFDILSTVLPPESTAFEGWIFGVKP